MKFIDALLGAFVLYATFVLLLIPTPPLPVDTLLLHHIVVSWFAVLDQITQLRPTVQLYNTNPAGFFAAVLSCVHLLSLYHNARQVVVGLSALGWWLRSFVSPPVKNPHSLFWCDVALGATVLTLVDLATTEFTTGLIADLLGYLFKALLAVVVVYGNSAAVSVCFNTAWDKEQPTRRLFLTSLLGAWIRYSLWAVHQPLTELITVSLNCTTIEDYFSCIGDHVKEFKRIARLANEPPWVKLMRQRFPNSPYWDR